MGNTTAKTKAKKRANSTDGRGAFSLPKPLANSVLEVIQDVYRKLKKKTSAPTDPK